MSTELIRYDAMCQAIASAYQVDEVKDIRDKAIAIEVYSRQARNVEAERQACEIRLRAERRCGQLLAVQKKAKGGGDQKSLRDQSSQRARTDTKTISDMGISYTQSSRWQKLAEIPDDQFNATFVTTAEAKPSTNGILAANAPPVPTPPPPPTTPLPTTPLPAMPAQRPVDERALWLWGRLLDFERMGLLAIDPNSLCPTMLEHMRETTFELAPQVAAWLGKLGP